MVQISDNLMKQVDAKIRSGQVASLDEVVRAGIESLERAGEAQEIDRVLSSYSPSEITAMLNEAENSGSMSEDEFEKHMDELERSFLERKART